MKAPKTKGWGVGGSRDFRVTFARISIPRMAKAATRMVQGKPILSSKCSTRIGNITPPTLDPAAIMPRARARWWKNHVQTAQVAA